MGSPPHPGFHKPVILAIWFSLCLSHCRCYPRKHSFISRQSANGKMSGDEPKAPRWQTFIWKTGTPTSSHMRLPVLNMFNSLNFGTWSNPKLDFQMPVEDLYNLADTYKSTRLPNRPSKFSLQEFFFFHFIHYRVLVKSTDTIVPRPAYTYTSLDYHWIARIESALLFSYFHFKNRGEDMWCRELPT